ncbi:immune-associated nucleotide-binding protein 9-like [Cornus florida]|uniref:immune-associated nucleotide-binding protein 9-like n=1 Tax=Cornus florida TaxID=4283 RepID=UPI0028A237AA|nr:immune-associated nucleotide-binding protein 9-like [Cornus florida]
MGGSSFDDELDFTSPSIGGVRTVVLVGRTGNGKSATGNSILGRKAFTSKASSAGVTSTCELQSSQILNVIDTPGLFDSSAGSELIGNEIVKCINMAKDGIHAVLVVLSVKGRFSKEEAASLRSLRTFFGTKINDYMIIVFTNGDSLEEESETLQDYLGRDCPEPLKEILELCENRQVVFDNKTKDECKKSEQVGQLLSLVDEVMAQNDGRPYTYDIFQLRDQTGEVSNGEMPTSYEEQVKRITDVIESKMRESTCMLHKQLKEEQDARMKAEDISQAAKMKSNDEMRKLREQLRRAQREMGELRNNPDVCAIL